MYRIKELVSKLVISKDVRKTNETINLVNWVKTNDDTEIVYM